MESKMYKDILYQVEDNIARITLNNPEKMNRLSGETMKEIAAALNEAGGLELFHVFEEAVCSGGRDLPGEGGRIEYE